MTWACFKNEDRIPKKAHNMILKGKHPEEDEVEDGTC
jgi:hypothetical protein